jgi:dTDP-4-amino-4,6-dideoxy-D-galactose acyltransferase
VKKLFVFNNEVNPYQTELEMAFNRLSDEGSVERVELNNLSINFLKSKKIGVVIADNLPQEWVYILKGMHIVSLIFGDAVNYHHEADIVIDYKGTDSVKYFHGNLFSMSNADFDISEVVNVIYKMKWDSDFFGFPIAFVGSRYLSDNIQLLIEDFVKKNKIKLVEYLCNCHDDLSVKVAEKNGYHFTDIRITFTLSLKKHTEVFDEAIFPGKFGLAKVEHIESLCAMTNLMYKDSRYFYDGNFDLQKINSFYSEWIQKAVTGKFDHECICYFEDDKPLGFCTIRYNQNNSVNIGLFGVGSSYAGKGIGKALLMHVMHTMKLKGLDTVNVVTQGRNYPAQKLYQAAGFRTFTTELWYHKWMN